MSRASRSFSMEKEGASAARKISSASFVTPEAEPTLQQQLKSVEKGAVSEFQCFVEMLYIMSPFRGI